MIRLNNKKTEAKKMSRKRTTYSAEFLALALSVRKPNLH